MRNECGMKIRRRKLCWIDLNSEQGHTDQDKLSYTKKLEENKI